MQTRRLGTSDRELSVLGYGAWVTGTDTFSRSLDDRAVVRAIHTALDSGMSWIDTAELYAGGLSEELVGRAVASARHEVFVATKVAPRGAGMGMRPTQIGRAIRGSLQRLNRDHIDLYQLHWHDQAVPLEDTWGAMGQLVEAGLARLIGVCNFDRPLVERCRSVGRVDAVQNQLSLLHRQDLTSFLPWLEAHRIAYLAYGSLAFGLLSGAIRETTRFGESDWRSGHARWERNYYDELFAPGRLERHVSFVTELGRLGRELELSLPVLAMRWVLEQPGVTAVVMGSSRPAHIRANARAGRDGLDQSTLARIGELLTRV